VSAAGVSAGIDMALALTERVHGRDIAEALQLIIEYDPQPPFDSGSLPKAEPRIRRLARRIMLGDQPVRAATRFGRELVRARMRRGTRQPT
jgi:cyclohexyl-isocyanide hydratase